MKRLLVAVTMLSLAACGGGGGGDVTSPSGVPNVAGTYSGNIKMAINDVPANELPAQLTVAQEGAKLTIIGSLAGSPIAPVTGTLDSTGKFTSTSGGAAGTSDAQCGTIVNIDASLTFSGRNAQYVEHDSTANCGIWSFSGTLTK